MQIKDFSDLILRSETKQCAARERHETALLIEHLIEINKRNLHLAWGFGSLFHYLTDELCYEKGAASLRVSAVYASDAVKDLPKKIETGELSLKAIRTVESFAYHERKSRGQELSQTEKQEIYSKIENLSVSKAEIVLTNLATSEKFLAPTKEIDRAVKGNKRVIQFTLTEEEYEMLQLAKEVLSHQIPDGNLQAVYTHMTKAFVERKHPKFKAQRALEKAARQTCESIEPCGTQTNLLGFTRQVGGILNKELELGQTKTLNTSDTNKADQDFLTRQVGKKSKEALELTQTQIDTGGAFQTGKVLEKSANQNNSVGLTRQVGEKRSRYIPAQENHLFWSKYDGKGCVYTDPITGKRCGIKHRPQRDHKLSFALGGPNTAKNLQLYCAAHNRYKAQLELAARQELLSLRGL